ncbi:Non-structural maintenance of chromosomes element 1 like [Cercospora zeina]
MSDDEPDGAVYGDTHRAFLQALFARQTITFEEAKPLISSIRTAVKPNRPHLPEDVTEDEFEDYIQRVNDALDPFDFEIRNSLHQISRERIYALVNTTSDALTQLATTHSPDDIAYVKRILDAMFDTYNTPRQEIMAITAFQAGKLAKAPGGGGGGGGGGTEADRRDSGQHGETQQTQSSKNASLTQSQAEKVIESMVQEGWFEKTIIETRSGRETVWYTASQRALMELQQWLVDAYNGEEEDDDDDDGAEPHQKIKFCKACAGIVTVGQRCPNLPCNVRLHEACVGKMFRAQRDSETCPACKTEWRHAPKVGIVAAKEPGAGSGGLRRSTNGVGAASGRRSNGTQVVEDESSEGQSDTEMA